MRRRIITVVAMTALTITTMASKCFEVTDPLVLTLNTSDITATSNVQQGVTTFGTPPSCMTVNPSQYLNTDLHVTGARIYDLTIQTSGAFTGNINNAQVTVNGTPLVTFNGPWSSFSTPQSILTSTALQRNAAGVAALVNAVTQGQPVTLCSSGAFSQASTAGLSVTTTLKAQVDVEP